MSRVRISTSVDQDRLEAARAAVAGTDSVVIDRALIALLRELDHHRERTVLAALPYEDDDEVSWVAPDGPDLPYDGDVPSDVLRLAAERRRARRLDPGQPTRRAPS